MKNANTPEESPVPTRNRKRTRQAIAIALGGLGVAGIIVGTLPAHAAGGYDVIVVPRAGAQSFLWTHDGQFGCEAVTGGPQMILPTTGAGDEWQFNIFSKPGCDGLDGGLMGATGIIAAAPNGETGEWIVNL